MASLYKRPRSPFWWIKYRDGSKIVRRSTRFLIGSADHLRLARSEAARRTISEQANPSDPVSGFFVWVEPFLRARHASSPRTLRVSLCNWRKLQRFLLDRHLDRPAQITRQTAYDYVAWLKSDRPSLNHNTIIKYVIFLGKLMREAANRSWIPGNPITRLGLCGVPPTEKTELSDAHAQIIRQAIAEAARSAASPFAASITEALRVSFEITLAQGLRLSETWFPLDDVDFDRMTIAIVAKGGRRYYPPLNPSLAPLLLDLKRRGQTHTYDRPLSFASHWHKLFARLRAQHPGLEHVSFHSARVRMVSRLARAGVSESVAMKMVNHSSSVVHRIYRRVSDAEVGAVWFALNNGSQNSHHKPIIP